MKKLIWLAAVTGAAALSLTAVSASAASASTTLAPHSWRHDMQHLAPPGKGCFTGAYPAVRWDKTNCHAPPAHPVPMGPAKAGPQTVGDTYGDYDAEVSSGSISSSTGSFPSVSAGATESGIDHYDSDLVEPNIFTLQLNTQFFLGSPACSTSSDPGDCYGWQQFIYDSGYPSYPSDGAVYMQYWLLDYDLAGTGLCPVSTGPYVWESYKDDCYTDSEIEELTAPLTVATLESTTLTGTAEAGGNDAVILAYGGNSVSAVNEDSQVGLAGNWTTAQFNIFGDGEGSQANFSTPTTMDVETAVDNGTTTAPSCYDYSYTAETNNLSFASPGCTAASATEPYIESTQTDETVTVTNPGAQTATEGKAITPLKISATDSGSFPLSYRASGLPPGLTISASGVISGTPSEGGSFGVTVTAASDTGAAGSASFTWAVRTDKLTITSPGRQVRKTGQKVRLRLHAVSTTGSAIRFTTATGLPPGLRLSASGLISGRLTRAGTHVCTVRARDADGTTASVRFTWVVRRA